MSRSGTPFEKDDDQVQRPASAHSTSVILPVRSNSSQSQSQYSNQISSPSHTFVTATTTSTRSSSYSAPNSPVAIRRILYQPQLIHNLPPFVLNHPQLQRLRDEAADSNRQRFSQLCRFSLNPSVNSNSIFASSSSSSSLSSSIPIIPRQPSPILVQGFPSDPRSRSLSHSFPSYGHPIRSSTICVSFTPGSGSSSGSITVRRTRTDPAGFKVTTSSSSLSSPNPRSSSHNLIEDMSYNRQQSSPLSRSPVPPASPRPNERKTSIEVPPRPASSSPTAMSSRKMRLVPIMQPISADPQVNGYDDSGRLQQQQSNQNQLACSSRDPYPHQVFTSEKAQANYIRSLLEHQQKRLQDMEDQVHRMEYNVKVKRASVQLREADLYKRLILQTSQTFDSYRSLDRLIAVMEELRELKVSIICLVTEIDHHGDHYLGDVDLKKVVSRTAAAAAAPPVPPRPSPSKFTNPGLQQSFSILNMRVPTGISCTGSNAGIQRRISTSSNTSSNSTSSNTLTPGLDGSYLRCNSQGYTSSSPQPDDQPNVRSQVDAEAGDSQHQQWRCTSCTFSNHPGLPNCEVCEKPKTHYVPSPSSPNESAGNQNNHNSGNNNNSHNIDCNERIVNFAYLSYDLMNRPFVLIPVSFNCSPAALPSSPTDIQTALTSLSNQLNLILPSNFTQTLASPQSVTTDYDTNANLNNNSSNADPVTLSISNHTRRNSVAGSGASSSCYSHSCKSNGCYCHNNKPSK